MNRYNYSSQFELPLMWEFIWKETEFEYLLDTRVCYKYEYILRCWCNNGYWGGMITKGEGDILVKFDFFSDEESMREELEFDFINRMHRQHKEFA